MDRQALEQQLQEEIDRLRSHASTTADGCSAATMIAASDRRVQELLVQKVAEGNVFRGARCVAPQDVLFVFECSPGGICLVPRSFLVRVNFASRRVTDIIDPYDLATASTALPSGPGPGTARARDFAAATASASASAKAGTRPVAVTITNVSDRSTQFDGHDVPFPPSADTTQTNLAPGGHRIDWEVQAPPGTPFQFTLTGATVPFTFADSVDDSQRANGFFHFTVA